MNADGPTAPRAIPRWWLAALALAVLALHLLLLQASPESWRPVDEPAPRAQPLITRTLPAPAPPPAAARTPPPAPTRARPAKPPRPVPERSDDAPASAPPSLPDTAATAPPPEADSLASAPGEPPADSAAAAPPSDALPEAPPDAAMGPVAVPPAARLVYDVSAEVRRMHYSAQAELQWQHDGTNYEAQLSVSAFLIGARTQTSVGRLTPQGLAPSRFADKKRRSEQAAHFDRERQRITFSANTPEAPLLPGAQDRLSLFLQLGALLAGDPARFAPGAALTIQTAGAREAEPWLFTVEGHEPQSLAGQPLETVKLVRQPRREYDARVELWYGRLPPHLPVRIRITQTNGDYVDQTLHSVEPAGTP